MIAPVEVAAVLATVTDTPSRWTIAPRWGNWKWSGRGRLVFIITQAAPPERRDAQCRIRATASVSSGIGARLARVTISTSCCVCLSIFASPRSASMIRDHTSRNHHLEKSILASASPGLR
jgi:hypothetical protein